MLLRLIYVAQMRPSSPVGISDEIMVISLSCLSATCQSGESDHTDVISVQFNSHSPSFSVYAGYVTCSGVLCSLPVKSLNKVFLPRSLHHTCGLAVHRTPKMTLTPYSSHVFMLHKCIYSPNFPIYCKCNLFNRTCSVDEGRKC
uniref:Gag-Pol polyprotein n=1 Tax=Schistocephalus solidus TaxID=70667 RepID=A0A0X3P6X0_SCHSO